MTRAWPAGLALLAGCDEAIVNVDVPAEADPLPFAAFSVTPDAVDFDTLFVGETRVATLTVTNDGSAPLALTFEVVGGFSMAYTLSTYTADPGAGESSSHVLSFTPTEWGNHGVSVLVSDADSGERAEVAVTAWAYIDDDGDGYASSQSGGGDCDDDDDAVYPGADDPWYDGVDQDCAGNDDYDQDADGARVDDDCDDTDPARFPGNTETWYDGVDGDCAGGDDYDQDQDGYRLGDDCDDTDPDAFPGATDRWYDGVDSDCLGNDDDDQDYDGYPRGEDCDDTDPAVNPGAEETWYDGVDQDCQGDDDDDQDADGVPVDSDCDDTDPTLGEVTAEVLNALDDDCNGLLDDVSVSDVATGVVYGTYAGQHLGDHGYLGATADITGDGAPDVVLGSPSYGYGYAFVLDGARLAAAAGDVDDYDTAVVLGSSGYMPLGYVNGPMGDVDGDGVGDLLVGAGYGGGYYGYGRGYLFLGGSGLAGSLPVAYADATFDSDDSSDFERMVASVDIDGDGLADVVAGAALDDGDGQHSRDTDAGSVAVYSALDIDGAMEADDDASVVHGDDDYDYLGTSLTTGDLDGDGYGDVVVGAPGYDGAASGGGAVYVLRGNATLDWDDDIDDAAALVVEGDTAYLALGEDTLPHPGDVDGSGNLDLGLTSEASGFAWVHLDAGGGSGAVALSTADHVISGTPTDLGSMMVIDSDLDGDGTCEIVVGADGDDTVASAAGLVHIFAGGSWAASLTGADASATIYGRAANYYFGSGGAGGFDLDGDGRDDLMVGEWAADDTAADGGAVWFVPGW